MTKQPTAWTYATGKTLWPSKFINATSPNRARTPKTAAGARRASIGKERKASGGASIRPALSASPTSRRFDS